ncbi:MAG: AAA family ATPase [Gemmataceae bacterium]|nr:AAA family ATPase [Gemmataceae bacterium]MCI0738860.1 AAA family ATPase [Gemmataceae bacterium]
MPFLPASQIQAEKVHWLWQSRFAFDYLYILDGDPGLGKTYVLLDLCARLSKGREFPDGVAGLEPCTALYLSGEDHPHDVLRPRLEALGADLERIHLWQHRTGEPWPYFPSRIELLRERVSAIGARLIVIDPLFGFLDPGVSPASDQHVRQALGPLAQLAEESHCCVILARHPNKRVGGRALYRGSYSIAFNAFCRATWIMGRNPDAAEEVVLAQVKNNHDELQPSLTFAIKPDAAGHARVEWLGQSRCLSDDLTGVIRYTQRLRACAFLQNFLKDGPRVSGQVRAAAQDQGFSRRTLDRAVKKLKITSQRVHAFTLNQKDYWLLPGQKLAENLMSEGEAKVARWMDQVEARALAMQRGEYEAA